jgi:thiol-disulfide isomerase/thioredoxin
LNTPEPAITSAQKTVAALARSSPKHRARRRLAALVALGLAVLATAGWFREPLRRRLAQEAILASRAPSVEAVGDMIVQASEPRAALLAAWKSGRIVQREAALRSVPQVAPANQPLPAEIETLVLSGALDPDLEVREMALTLLLERHHPALPAMAAEQLKDVDLEVRLLGLDYLKTAEASLGVPTVIPLLDDPDPLLVAVCLKLLEHWSGQDFGVKLRETTPVENESTGLKEYRPSSSEKARAGAQRAKAWWSSHPGEFPAVTLQVPRQARSTLKAVAADDFQLPSLDGSKVRLSDFRGKVVLLSFWTTWCSSCLGEMPELIALRKKHPDALVILGVSLDGVLDEHGRGEHAAVEDLAAPPTGMAGSASGPGARERVRAQVLRIAKTRAITYPILLDPDNEVGGRFNGSELPTTVILDPQGHVRRRFVGARNLKTYEAMIAEAAGPPS